EIEPVADVAVVHSRRAEEAFGSNDPREDGYIQHVRGFELALFENHIPFHILPEARISRDTLASCQVVVLPNTALLSDDQQTALRDYVRAGGGIVASYEASLRGASEFSVGRVWC
ncbi:MAG: beta-galactosidase trimerization domain-containing protein, partial [Nocardioidaceae bacterium]